MRELEEGLEPRSVMRRVRQFMARTLLAIALLVTHGLAAVDAGRSEELRAELDAAVANGHGRLIFTFAREIKSNVRFSNGILIVAFERPVAVAVEQLDRKLPGYVQAARRDPDGSAVRVSLARRVSVNVMEAGEKLFVDLLPDGWRGLPPGLPQDVIDELAQRARDAERNARARAAADAPPALVRLHVSHAPTFSRFAFQLPEPIAVTAERDGQELRLRFDAPVKFDIGEAKTHLPAGVVALDVAFEDERSVVKLVLAPNADAREFREEQAYLVDVTPPPGGGAVRPAILGLATEAEAQAQRERVKAEAAAATEMAAASEAALRARAPLAEGGGADGAPAPLDLTTGPGGTASGTLIPVVGRQSGQFSVAFAFPDPVPAAIFTRGDNIWMVFDTPRAIDVSPMLDDPTRTVQSAHYLRSALGAVVRLKLARTRLPSVERDGNTWRMTLADSVLTPSRPLPLRRAPAIDEGGAALVPLEAPGQLHRITDPEVGDTILAITAQPPARGILRSQHFVEFRALASIQGLAFVPIADDLSVTLAAAGVTIGRPTGLTVSELPAPPPPMQTVARKSTLLEVHGWKAEAATPYAEREAALMRSVSASPPGQRADARLMLARFYLAHAFAAEAKGVLEAGAREDNQLLNRSLYYLLRGMAELDLGRPAEALAEFTNPHLAAAAEATLLRGVAQADLGRWEPARDALRIGADAYPDLPPAYQRQVLLASARAAVEVRDFAEASRAMHDLEVMDVPPAWKPTLALLTGRIAEGIGRFERARALYDAVAATDAGPDAAEAQLRSIAMRHARGELDRPKAIDRLETLAVLWRGDRIELETIRLLGRLYVAESRYRAAFKLLDAALLVDAEAEITREFHREMATVFEDLYLTGKSATLPPVEALALYYDFSRLTPIGRRGDELIRRLVDRLVSIDLLDQAAELLDHQVNYRLSGAAKAQVAAKLAVVHLMNRKPADAVRVLVGTRMPQLPQELREQRLFIEARALSDSGRHAAALELVRHLWGPEVDRLRADIAWAGKNWREAGERLEKLVGGRGEGEPALGAMERHDVLRAALAYAFGEETIGLARLKEKYADRMGETPEGKVLTLLVSREGTSARTLADAAKALANFDSLGTFLKLQRERYPEGPLAPDPTPTSGLTQKLSVR